MSVIYIFKIWMNWVRRDMIFRNQSRGIPVIPMEINLSDKILCEMVSKAALKSRSPVFVAINKSLVSDFNECSLRATIWTIGGLTYTVGVVMLILTNTTTNKTPAVFQGSFLLCTVIRSSVRVIVIWLDFYLCFWLIMDFVRVGIRQVA